MEYLMAAVFGFGFGVFLSDKVKALIERVKDGLR